MHELHKANKALRGDSSYGRLIMTIETAPLPVRNERQNRKLIQAMKIPTIAEDLHKQGQAGRNLII